MLKIKRLFEDKHGTFAGIEPFQQHQQGLIQEMMFVHSPVDLLFGMDRSGQPLTDVLLLFCADRLLHIDGPVDDRSGQVSVWILYVAVVIEEIGI